MQFDTKQWLRDSDLLFSSFSFAYNYFNQLEYYWRTGLNQVCFVLIYSLFTMFTTGEKSFPNGFLVLFYFQQLCISFSHFSMSYLFTPTSILLKINLRDCYQMITGYNEQCKIEKKQKSLLKIMLSQIIRYFKIKCCFCQELPNLQYSFMKAIKLDADTLQKAQQYTDNDNYANNLRQFKKKQATELKNKIYQFDSCKFETKNNSPGKNLLQQNENHQNEVKCIIDKSNLPEDQQKQSKSSLKLPSINMRGNKRTSFDSKNDPYAVECQQNGDLVKQSKFANQTNQSQQKNRGSGKTNLTQEDDNDKVTSFLKYIQIKSMKPAEKAVIQKNDMSVRDLKIARQQKSIPLKLNRTNDRQLSPSNTVKKSSQSKLRVKKNEQKSEKVISNYTIRKQKRALSISQNTQPSKMKKLTNTYYDFCNFVCVLNKVQRPSTPVATYKAYVGKGNNSILVKNNLKSRFWWNIVDSQGQVNLYWTQTRDLKFVQTLKIFQPNRELKQLQNEKKSIQFIIPKQTKQQNADKGQLIRQYTNCGLNRFLSEQQRKQYSKSQYQIEFPLTQTQQIGNPNKNKIHNHLQFHWHISNKKALYYNLKKYYLAMKEDPFEYIPLTFHIQKHGDEEWERFIEAYNQRDEELKKKKQDIQIKGEKKKKKQKNLWIVKPGQNSNQGNGIQVFDNIQEIAQMVKISGDRPNGRQRSYIVQRYLMPFLYCKRKFDIRCYVLVTCIKGVYKAYWYEQGYIRTSSKQFTLKNLKNRFIHLTNDAVQKKSQDYGKYQNGNKISFADFEKYLDNSFPEKQYKFFKSVYPSMIKRASDAIKSTCMLMDSKKRQFTFQIFGLDFMIDQDFATWLIEVNTNPCLELSSPLLARIIPNMVQNALKIAVDPLFPPPKDVPKTKNLPLDLFETNKFTLIFNSSEDQQILTNLTKDTNLSNIVESDEQDDNHDDID